MKTEKRQLFYKLETLSSSTDNENLLGSLVGYSVVSSITFFDPMANRPKAIRRTNRSIKEINEVYDGMDFTINQLIEKNDSKKVLSDLKEILNPELEKYLNPSNPLKNYKNHLFRTFHNTLSHTKSKPNLEEYLRILGIDITREVGKRGVLSSARNRIYSEDYSLIEQCLNKEKNLNYS